MYPVVLKKILLPIGSFFFSGHFSKYLKEWEKYDRMSAEALEQLQQQRLTKILDYARKKVPYYQDLNLPESASLQDFPVLTKDILRSQSDRLIAQGYSISKLEKNHSSGSSGIQSVTYMTPQHKAYVRALQTHWWQWGGFRPGERTLQTGISPQRTFIKKVKDLFFRVSYLNAFQLQEQNTLYYLKKIKHSQPKHLIGYPSALNEIALTALKHNQTTSFTSLISLGDKLFDHYRDHFNLAFNNPTLINTYGCAEGLMIGSTYDLPYYYLMSPHVFIEIVDDHHHPVADGQRGHILVTCLTNYAMPLIRYRLGDLGILLPKDKYPESRKLNYPLLQEITGRETDVIHAPNGNSLIVHSFTGILEYYQEIKQYKVVQTQPDELVIEYITANGEHLEENVKLEILQRLTTLTAGSMQISFKLVKEILPSPSGKPQIIEIKL